ncbi:hypothetical protein BDQ17DRAFT_1340959 [Cyathus striatus]|nr:hypothetical protein BDQ17DRAFT_1340959 [Cyathus striatus]
MSPSDMPRLHIEHVVDIDPSPVPSNSPRHALVSHSFQEEPNKSPIAPVSRLIGIPQDRTDPLLSSSLDLFDQPLSNLLNEEPFFIDPTTFRPIHHVGGHFREHQLPQYETPVYLHELSGTAPTNESQPSLGYLDEALSFIAAERAKWMVQRESGSGIGDSKWKHVIEPRRKRRRKRLPKSAPSTLASTTPLGSATPVANSGLQTTTTDGDNDNDDDDDDDPSKDDTPRKQLEEGYLSLSGHLGQSKKGRLQREKGKVRGKNAELPQEGLDEDTPRPKRERLQELARKLQEVFPEDRSKLEIIINQLGNVTERSDSKRRHTNANNCKDSFETDENNLDPRGPPPTRDDTLIHVFIDHSNILIGLLSHLKRYPPSRVKEAKSNARSLTSASGDDVPVRNLASHNHSSPLLCVEETTDGHFPLIPLPSFATASAKDASNRERAQRENMKIKKSNSDGDEKIERGINATLHRKSKKPVRHLWHAALTLILERGRPINRRVLVTSSPLYQPMDGIERLGYEVRVYLRVPDLGDGMDRERGGSRHNKSNSASGNNFNAIPVGMAGNSSQLGHKRKFSNSSNENHISATTSIATNSDLHPFYTATDLNNNINTNAAVVGRGTIGARGTTRIKYREQGVDELLQLKLHQALAATDEVPDGSTIILATGDGNVGQFNEDGFLGPVRTALRRGWKVELYAWEDGLSRSWRREFGEDSEWGRNGMFRIIGMEQFANRLVEAVAW